MYLLMLVYLRTNYFVPDHSESEDDQAQENHPSKERKFVEQQHDQQQVKKHQHASLGQFTTRMYNSIIFHCFHKIEITKPKPNGEEDFENNATTLNGTYNCGV